MQRLKKYKIFFFISLICISSFVFGQETGLKGGIVFSTLKGVSGVNLRPGIQLGGYKTFGDKERLYFRTEVLFTQKGSWSWNTNLLNNISLAYLDVAFFFCVDVSDKLNLNFGFQPSVLLIGRHRFKENDVIHSNFVGQSVSRFDYSTLIGLEYLYKENIFLGIRYNHSFVPIQGYGGTISTSGSLPISRVFQLYAGLKLK